MIQIHSNFFVLLLQRLFQFNFAVLLTAKFLKIKTKWQFLFDFLIDFKL